MSYSYRLILLPTLLPTGLPLCTQSVTEEAKSVHAMVSGIVSYTRQPALPGLPKLCIFSLSRFSSVLKDTSMGILPHPPVIIRTEQEISVSQCDSFYFGKESPTYQVELKNKCLIEILLLITEQNSECVVSSAFYLVVKDEGVGFSVNMDSLSRNGVGVSPDVLMPARNNKHGQGPFSHSMPDI